MEKILFLKAICFAADDHRFSAQDPNSNGRQAELFLPLEAISHLVQKERGNINSGYIVHFKKGYPLNPPFPIKSINPVHLNTEQVQVLNAH